MSDDNQLDFAEVDLFASQLRRFYTQLTHPDDNVGLPSHLAADLAMIYFDAVLAYEYGSDLEADTLTTSDVVTHDAFQQWIARQMRQSHG